MKILESTKSIYFEAPEGISRLIAHSNDALGWMFEFRMGSFLGHPNRYFVTKRRVFNFFSIELEKQNFKKEDFWQMSQKKFIRFIESLTLADYERYAKLMI